MASFGLVNRAVVFDPELELESVRELPGKDTMLDIARRFGESARCSSLIQDSHGWCFYVRADDGRKYLVELSYVATKGGASIWVLSCSRCAGLRFWEWFRSLTANTDRELYLLDKGVEFLVSHHGYERVDT